MLGLGAATVLGVGCGLAGCIGRRPWRVGFLGGLTGRMVDLGVAARNGVQLAVEEINAAGGLVGRDIELISRDDEQDSSVAQRGLRELLAAGVDVVIGPMTSSMALAVLPLAQDSGVPLVSPLAGAGSLSGRTDVFFRVVSDAPSSARQQAEAIIRRGIRRLVTVADVSNRAFTIDWIRALSERFVAMGGVVLGDIEFQAGAEVRFTALAQRLAAIDDADGVAMATSATDSAVLVQHLRRLRPQQFVALSVWAGTEELPRLGGSALDGVLVTQFYDRFSRLPAWLSFVERFQARFGETPGYPALNGFDALQMVAAAARSVGNGPLLPGLSRLRSLQGLQRTLTFDDHGDCLAPTYLAELREGRYVAAAT